MSCYCVESGVPLMEPYRGRPASEERKAMRALSVGQSFLIEDAKRAEHARWVARTLGRGKFSVRKVTGGWRVWRIE